MIRFDDARVMWRERGATGLSSVSVTRKVTSYSPSFSGVKANMRWVASSCKTPFTYHAYSGPDGVVTCGRRNRRPSERYAPHQRVGQVGGGDERDADRNDVHDVHGNRFLAVPSSLVTVSRREQSPGWVRMKM